MLFSQYVSQYLSEKKAKKAKYILLWTMLYRSLLDTHKYEWVNLLDFQYAKKKQKLNTHKSTQCIKFFEVKIYCYFSSEDSSKLFINVKEYIKILNCLIKKIRCHYCSQNQFTPKVMQMEIDFSDWISLFWLFLWWGHWFPGYPAGYLQGNMYDFSVHLKCFKFFCYQILRSIQGSWFCSHLYFSKPPYNWYCKYNWEKENKHNEKKKERYRSGRFYNLMLCKYQTISIIQNVLNLSAYYF